MNNTDTLAAVRLIADELDRRGFFDGRQGHAARAVLRDLVDELVAESNLEAE